MTYDEELDPVILAALTAVQDSVFPPDHPGQVCTLDDDGVEALAGGTSSPRLEHFTIYERLGRGSTGEVYRARDDRTDRIVAIKFMRAGTEKDALRLEGEARLLVRCTHPNIVHVHQVATQSEARVVLVMEHIAGTTLDVWLSAHHHPREILRLLTEVGRALEAAHNVGVIHRDIQPTNIMVDDLGRAKLIDFGLANVEKPANGPNPAIPTHVSPMVGTYEYIAPEHHKGAGCTNRSDQFSFCALLYRSLYGQPPHPLPVTQLPARPRLAPHVRAALLRGLSVDPDARWPSMDHLLQELARPWWKKRRYLHALAALLFFLLGIACVLILLAQFDREPEIEACVRRLSAGIKQADSTAAALGIRSETDLLLGQAQHECREAIHAGDSAYIDDLVLCLDIQSEAIAGLAALKADDSVVPRPRINLAWGQQRDPLPLLARCAVDPALKSSAAGRISHVRLVQLRLLLQHQQYAAAREVLMNTSLLADLAELGADAARAEAWVHAAQVARRYAQQRDLITIDSLGVDLLLDLAVGASAGVSEELHFFARLERVHRSIDRKDYDQARALLRPLMQSDPITNELNVRVLQAHARIVAVDDPLGAAELIQRIAMTLTSDERLSNTGIPVELQGLRALYRAKVDPKLAHKVYDDAITVASQKLGPHDYLVGIIAANAMRNAFAVNDIERGEQWGNIALNGFNTAFGERTIPVEQLSYDLARNLLLAGESLRGLTYADRALGYARQLRSATETSYVLHLRNLLEMRIGRLEAALRSAKEALDTLPEELASDPVEHHYFLVAILGAEAEENIAPKFVDKLRTVHERIEADPALADVKERRELIFLLAQALARQNRLAESEAILDKIELNRLGDSSDSITRGDVHMLRALFAEARGHLAKARLEACKAKDLYESLHTDGRRRLEQLSAPAPRPYRTPSPELFNDCQPGGRI